MKQKIINITHGILCTILLAGTVACNDAFDEHYSNQKGVAPETTLWQLIEQDNNLSLFKQLLEETGYAALLKSSQAFTVWAPDNAALQNVDKTDVAQMRNLIRTHIARFQYPAVRIDETVYTINAKRLPFLYDSGTGIYTLKGAELENTNSLASNGILHTLKTPAAYVKNLWETALTEPDMDSIRNFFESFHSRIFYPSGSKIIDYIGGKAVYDSIFVETNRMWYPTSGGVGALNNEDSIYTLVLPNNTAWAAAYTERFPYFETTAPFADSLQRLNTQNAIVQDLVFRKELENNFSDKDSLYSTRGNLISNLPDLFAGLTKTAASNGAAYVTNELRYKHWESWHHGMTIEAERGIMTLKENINASPATLTYVYLPTYEEEIPSQACILVTNGQNQRSAVTSIIYDVPNTLKAAYNIYAVFAPTQYWESTDDNKREKTRIGYDIQQLDRSTANEKIQTWKSLVGGTEIAVNGKDPDDAGGNETESAKMRKILLAANFTFPEANYGERVNTIRIKLVSRGVSSRPDINAGYQNRMLIDKIILEPVH